MEKIQKKAKKNLKPKKKQSVKVVYITNPIKFKASASEFRALVQELTGQDAADTAYFGGGFSAEDSGGEAAKMVEEDIVHATLEEEMPEIGRPSGEVDELDPTSIVGSYDDSFVYSMTIEGFQGLGSNLVDAFKSLDAM